MLVIAFVCIEEDKDGDDNQMYMYTLSKYSVAETITYMEHMVRCDRWAPARTYYRQ